MLNFITKNGISESIGNFLIWALGTRRPHKGEGERETASYLVNLIKEFKPKGVTIKTEVDSFGNVIVSITKKGVPNTKLFTAHMDTVHHADGKQGVWYYRGEENPDILYVVAKELPKKDTTAELARCVLGADDAAGMFVLLNMINAGINGTYAFFRGEERGCLGSKDYLDRNSKHGFKAVISFDRKGTTDFITHQRGKTQGCSDAFADALVAALNKDSDLRYSKSDKGSSTDSAQFIDRYTECANMSVGYSAEHTANEALDLTHLVKVTNQIIKIDWNSIPMEDKGTAWDDAQKPKYYGSNYGNYSSYVALPTIKPPLMSYRLENALSPIFSGEVDNKHDKALLILTDHLRKLSVYIDEVLAPLDGSYMYGNAEKLYDFLMEISCDIYDMGSVNNKCELPVFVFKGTTNDNTGNTKDKGGASSNKSSKKSIN